jgi:ADP-ribosylation factor related protein 1
MFGLLYGLWQAYWTKQEVFVLIVGLDNAGKTTLLERIKASYSNRPALAPQSIRPTVGLNIGRVDVGPHRLVLWDLGGQASLRAIWPRYFAEAAAIIFVVDSGDPERFDEAKAELEQVVAHPDLRGVPVLVLANKQDVPQAHSCAQVETVMAIPALATSCVALSIQPVVAITGQGVTEGLQWLIDAVQLHPRETPSTSPSSQQRR